MSASGSITIREVTDKAGRQDWLRVPNLVFRGDRAWVRPLDIAEEERISPRHNPLFTCGEAAFFVAYLGSAPVGRISAQINREHLARHNDATGHFGFFDCIDSKEAAGALVDKAASWLADRGMMRMLGPYSLTINQDAGLLVAGFDTPPAVLAGHARAWAGDLLEQCGLRKSMDLFAYRMHPRSMPRSITRLARLATESGRIRIRSIDMRRYGEEVALAFDIFNDAWSENWGFVPFQKADIDAIIRDTRPIMRSKFGRIAEVDGVPAAMIIALPDINQVIAPFNGRLLPFNWARLAWAIWRDRWTSARVPLLGIRKCHRATLLAPSLLSLLIAEIVDVAKSYDLDWVEFSWVLETNRQMVKLGELTAGSPARTYRLYEKSLSPEASA